MKFVIQEYRLSNGGVRYYLRLEKDGVLKGWAVPKGLPEKGERKRLALEVGPFKLSAAGYEGKVAKSKFGPGMMSVWDRGEYRLDSWLENRIIFELFGSRVKGLFALVRFTKAGSLHWLLSRPHSSTPAPPSVKIPETPIKAPAKSPSVPPRQRVPARRPTVGIKKSYLKSPPEQTITKIKSNQSKSEMPEEKIQKSGDEPDYAKSQESKSSKKRAKKRESYYCRSKKRAKRMNKRRYTKKIHLLGLVFIVFVLIIYGLVKLIQYLGSL